MKHSTNSPWFLENNDSYQIISWMLIASLVAVLVSLRKMSDCVIDLPPEYCQYHDDGCEFALSCLNCHLPICVYDEPGGKQRLLKRRRAVEMARLFTREGKSIGELAQIFGVSRRTVQRALKIAFGDTTEGTIPDVF